MMNEEETAVMKTAIRLLARRAHSSRELIDKLMARDYRYPVVLKIIDECKRHGYLNDELFTESYINELAARGQGAFRIRNKLREKGLPAELIKEKITELDEVSPPEERARRVLQTKLSSLQREPDPRKRREKAYRFLASRGFDADTIRRAVANTGDNDDENY